MHTPDEEHPETFAVNQLADAMKAKLAKKRDRGFDGGLDPNLCSNDKLSYMLREHVEKGDPVDVANFCMMLHARGETIGKATMQGFVERMEPIFDRVDRFDAAMKEQTSADSKQIPSHVNSGAYRRVDYQEWLKLGGGNNLLCDWHEGIGYVIYDDIAQKQFEKRRDEIAAEHKANDS